MAGHRGHGRGRGGPASYVHSDKLRQPLDTSSELQRARAHTRWAAHRERAAEGPEAVAAHARMCRLKKIKAELKREKRAVRSILMPSPARSEDADR
jgi:hypothetical protein